MSEEYECKRVGEVYELIKSGKIFTEPELRQSILNVFINEGLESVKNKKYWTREFPPDFLLRVIQGLEETIQSKKDQNQEEMTEAEIDIYRLLCIRFYRIRRVVKNLLKKEDV